MIDYIRFEPRSRFHAVYVDVAGVFYATFCGRLVGSQDVRHQTYAPPAICSCCKSRMAQRHLIPAWLRHAKEAVARVTKAA